MPEYAPTIHVMRQTRAERADEILKLTCPITLISICGKYIDTPRFPPLCTGSEVCSVRFEDITEGKRRIRARHARKIWRYVKRAAKNHRDIIVHCEAGKSRSAAVAIAIQERYPQYNIVFWEYGRRELKSGESYENIHVAPNLHVLSTMTKKPKPLWRTRNTEGSP